MKKNRYTKKQCHYCNYIGKTIEDTKKHEERMHGYFRDASWRKEPNYGKKSNSDGLQPKEEEKIVKGSLISLDGNEVPVTYEWNGSDYIMFAHIMNHKFPIDYDKTCNKFKVKGWEEKHKMLMMEISGGSDGFVVG